MGIRDLRTVTVVVDGCIHAADGRKPFAPRMEIMVETIRFVGIYRGIIRNQSFLGGANGFVHPHYVWIKEE